MWPLHSYQKEKFQYYLDKYIETQEALQKTCEKDLQKVDSMVGECVSQEAFRELVGGFHREKTKQQSATTITDFAKKLKEGKLSSNRVLMPEMLSLPLFQAARQANLKQYFTGESLDVACGSQEGYIPFADEKDTVKESILSLGSKHGDVWGVYVDLSSAFTIWHALLIGIIFAKDSLRVHKSISLLMMVEKTK